MPAAIGVPYVTRVTPRLEVMLSEGLYALARLAPGSDLPTWAQGEFVAMVRSRHGLTIACRQDLVPPGVESEAGFRCFEIVGPFELTSLGVVAAASGALAARGVSLFLFSTWETDFFLVKAAALDLAIDALITAGHTVRDGS